MTMMMINTDNKQIIEIVAFLEKLGISSQDCALAERYLKDEAGDEVLDQFQRIDFAAAAVSFQIKEELNSIEWRLIQNGMRDIWVRLFNVLFAIGHHTSSALFQSRGVDGENYKAAIIYIENSSEDEGYLPASEMTRYMMDDLLRDIDNKPENLRGIIDLLKGEGAKYYLTVLAAYFGTKYPETEALETIVHGTNTQESIPGCGKGLIEASDEPFLQAYEEGLLGCLDELLSDQGCVAHEEITAAVRAHRLTPELLAATEQCSFTTPAYQKLCLIANLAYINYMFSDVLRDIVRVCLSVDAERVLSAMADALDQSPEANGRIGRRGGDCSELFWIEPKTYIRWMAFETARELRTYSKTYAASVRIPILKGQLAKNQDSYLQALDQDGYASLAPKIGYFLEDAIKAVNVLKDVLKEENPGLYEQIGAGKPDYERIIGYLAGNRPHAQRAMEYLRGHCSISELYPYEAEFFVDMRFDNYIQEHKRHWEDECFLNRCNAFMALTGSEFTTIVEKKDLLEALRAHVNPAWKHVKVVEEEKKLQTAYVERFFKMLDGEQLDIAHQLKCFVASYTAYRGPCGCDTETLLAGAANAFAGYLDSERREETLAAFSNTRAEGRYLALLAMRKDTLKNRKEILSFASDTTKLIKNELLDILYGQRDWEEDIRILLLEGKKAAQRETAVQVLMHWQQEGGSYNDILSQALEQEKNAKVRTLLQGALNIQESDQPKETLTREELVKQLHKGGRKKSLAWAYEKPFPTVHRTDGGEASEEELQALLLCYVSQEKNGVSKNAQILASGLHAGELAIYMNELFDKWLAMGAESRKRWALYAAAIHGGEDIIQKIQHQIQEWPQAARGAIAAEAVKALALNPSPRALLLVDGIARKFKFKQVKAAAGQALEFAAAELGITREELSDRIVPDLGFDGNMERTFDYGNRIFKVMLTPTLDVEVYDENGKKLKNLPAPGKKDDADKAAAAYADFKEMKKQMKAAVTSQKARLEYALSVKREWSTDAWKRLFVQNPLMHQFAIGLIWGVYGNGSLIQGFRYMEDGSFNTQDGDEYILPAGAAISLVHPLELSDEDKAAWKEQLEDYEITQPIEQLDREVYCMTGEEADKQGLERFGGTVLNDLSLNGKLTGLGWYRGSVQDAGGFNTYYREDAEAGIGVELHFSGAYVGGMDDDVTIYDVRFYKAGTIARGSYVYDEADKDKAYFLKNVPPRYFSEIVLQLAKATASSEKRNENWKKEAQLL